MLGNAGVCFPALHFFKRAHIGVCVIESQHKAQCDFVVFKVVQKSATKAVVRDGPPRGVNHQAGHGQGGVDFPQFFDADGKGLRVFALVELETLNDLLAQMATRSFGKDGVFGV